MIGCQRQVNLRAVLRINDALGVRAGESGSQKRLLANGGRIVLLSSINGIAGAFGQTNYAFTKAALIEYVLNTVTSLAYADVPDHRLVSWPAT